MAFDIGDFPVELDFFLAAYEGPQWEMSPFRHRSGWLMLAEASIWSPFGERSAMLVAAVSDHGEMYHPQVAARLLDVPTSLPRDAECEPDSELEEAMDAAFWDFLGTVDLDNLRLLEEAQNEIDARITAFERDCAAFETKLWTAIRLLRAERRSHSVTEERKAEIEAKLNRYLEMPGELASGMRQRVREMREETEQLETAVFSSLGEIGELTHRSTVRWRARSGVQRHRDIRLGAPREWGLTRHEWQQGLSGQTLEQIGQRPILRFERDEE
ncbi:MAG: hypothetical protein ING31_12285 [Burkholderiales bacterium]|nr:hypothetical protein [Burkholderiales bacterium]